MAGSPIALWSNASNSLFDAQLTASKFLRIHLVMHPESVFEYHDYRNYLRDELARRIHRNARFSLRSFARQLGLAPSTLSEVLTGNHGLSEASSRRVASRLGFSQPEQVHWSSLTGGGKPKKRLSPRSLEQLREWYDYAALEVLKIQKSPSAASIARALGVPKVLIAASLKRLEANGLCQRRGKNGWRVRHTVNETSNETPSSVIRGLHAQLLDKAKQSLDEQSMQQRSFQAVVTAVPRKRLKDYFERLLKFRTELMQEFAKESELDSVYCLSMGFFELTKMEGKDDQSK